MLLNYILNFIPEISNLCRAYRDGADEESIVVGLLHDVGEMMTPTNHGEVAAALLRPYITPKNWWILEHHEVFQVEMRNIF